MVRPACGCGLGSLWWNGPCEASSYSSLTDTQMPAGRCSPSGTAPAFCSRSGTSSSSVDCPDDAFRAGHAAASDSLIVALGPGVTVELDNGSERDSHRLTDPATGLLVRAGVWLRLSEFGEGTRLVVLVSKPYGEMNHSDAPQPALLDEAGR